MQELPELSQAQAESQGYISISEALKRGLTKKNRSTLYREGMSFTLPACWVGKGTRKTMWILGAALSSSLSPKSESSYQTVVEQLKLEMKNGTLNGTNYKESTINSFISSMKRYWVGLKRSPSLSEIKASNFLKVIGSFEIDEENGKDHYSYKKNIFKALTIFLTFLIREGLAAPDSLDALKRIKFKSSFKPMRAWLEDYEVTEAIASNKSWRTSRSGADVISMDLMIHLFAYVGLRRREAIRLKVSDINFKEKLVRVRASIAKGGKERLVTPHPQFWPVIAKCLKAGNYSLDSFIIQTRSGEAISKSTVNKRFVAFSKRIKKHIHPHALRRAFAIMWANKGMPLTTLQMILGHTNIATTMDYLPTTIQHAQNWIAQHSEQEALLEASEVSSQTDDDVLEALLA